MIHPGYLLMGFAVLILLLQYAIKINMKRYVNLYFIIFLISGVSFAFSFLLPQNIAGLLGMIGSLWIYTVFSFVLLHSSVVLGNKKTAVFFSISFSLGLIFELTGVKYGWIGSYYYPGENFFFGLVPLTAPFSWTVLVYVAYTITNIFLIGFKGKKPSLNTSNVLFNLSLIILLSIIAGLITVNLDMILDPVAVAPQVAGWVWTNGGPYFGIPIGNYLGWFLVTFLAIILFRLYESLSEFNKKINPIELYIPIVYFIYFLMNAAQSIYLGHIEYVLIGATTMFPFLFIILLIYLNSKSNKL